MRRRPRRLTPARARAWVRARAPRCAAALALGALAALAGCALPPDAPVLGYSCTHGLAFQARLYADLALLEGGRGFDRLPRLPDGAGGVLRYGQDGRVLAEFGLGTERQLAQLRYAGIPDAIQCQRLDSQPLAGLLPRASGAAAAADGRPAAPPVQASEQPAPRPRPPPQPEAPIFTNIRTTEGADSAGR